MLFVFFMNIHGEMSIENIDSINTAQFFFHSECVLPSLQHTRSLQIDKFISVSFINFVSKFFI